MAKGKLDSTGVVHLETQLEKLATGSQKALEAVSRDIADDVLSYVRSRVPRLTGAAAGSYRAVQDRTGTTFEFGGPRAPYVPWLEFGGKAGRSGASRPYVPGGRYLYPGIRQVTQDWEHLIERELTELSDLEWR